MFIWYNLIRTLTIHATPSTHEKRDSFLLVRFGEQLRFRSAGRLHRSATADQLRLDDACRSDPLLWALAAWRGLGQDRPLP